MSPERRELHALEKEDKYVFHGSGSDVASLEPRQAHDDIIGPDGSPAVFASNVADYAIFMAIFNKRNCPQGSSTSAGAKTDEEHGLIEMRFAATRDTLDQLKDDAAGWVYVFNKTDFTRRLRGGVEYVSDGPVTPIKKIQVSTRDLPKNIAIRES